jgi:hypothetical protein
MLIEDIRKRKKEIPELKDFMFDDEIVEIGEMLITMRPDLPPVRDLLQMSEVFYRVFTKNKNIIPINGLANLIHTNHFLSFYRGDKSEI